MTHVVFDNSAVQCFRENPEAFRLKYRQHLTVAAPATHFGAGTALHGARNVLFDARRAGAKTYTIAQVDAAVALARTLRGDAPGRRNAEQCEAVVRAYAAVYAEEPFEIVANEEYVEAYIGCNCHASSASLECVHAAHCVGFAYCGILDAAIRFPDNTEYVFDLKSTGTYLNAEWEQCMRLADQFTGYVALRRAFGARCDGYYVDGIHMRDARPRKDGTLGTPSVDMEKDFVRVGPVQVPEWRIERWATSMRYTLGQIAELERTRGIDTPWPIYQNWSYGKVDEYRDFYAEPDELHTATAQTFVKHVWDPREVAEGRKVK